MTGESPGSASSPGSSSSAGASGLLGIAARMLLYKTGSRGCVAVAALVTARELGPTGRGELVLLLTAASFALLVCSLGVNTSGRIHLVAEVDPVGSGAYLGLAGALTVLQMVTCGVVGVTFLPLVGVQLAPLVEILFAVLGGTLIARYLLNDALNAYGFTTTAAALDGSANFTQLVLVVMLAVAGVDDLAPFVVSIAGANTLQIVLAFVLLRRSGVAIRPSYQRSHWLRLVRGGLPGIPMALGEVLTFRLDHYLLAVFLTPAEVGIYSVAASPGQLLRVPPTALSAPVFHRLASGSAKLADFRRARLLSIAATSALALLMFLAAPFAVRSILGPSYEEAVIPLRVLLLAEIGITIFYLDTAALAGLNRVGNAASAAVVGLVVVTISDVILIPLYGITGAAWASVIAYWSMGLLAHTLLQKHRSSMPSEDRSIHAPPT